MYAMCNGTAYFVSILLTFYMRNLQPWQNKLVHFENTYEEHVLLGLNQIYY
jgi:hypothetical protein